jgi:hypothetical protein
MLKTQGMFFYLHDIRSRKQSSTLLTCHFSFDQTTKLSAFLLFYWISVGVTALLNVPVNFIDIMYILTQRNPNFSI